MCDGVVGVLGEHRDPFFLRGTTMEREENIRRICKECAEKKHEETQRNLPPLNELIGKHVKKAFTDDHGVEHMWVEVQSVNTAAGTLIGILDNEPVLVTNFQVGDEVIVYISEIEEVFPSAGF